MTDAVQLALVASIAPTIAATAALIVGILNHHKSTAIVAKTEEIHSLTNSRLTQAIDSLKLANEKIEGLERLVGTLANPPNRGPAPMVKS